MHHNPTVEQFEMIHLGILIIKIFVDGGLKKQLLTTDVEQHGQSNTIGRQIIR